MQRGVCGASGCRCKTDPGQRHPYAQLSFTRKGRSSSRFVRKADVPRVKRQIQTYAKLRRLVDEWIELSTELCIRRIEESRRAAAEP